MKTKRPLIIIAIVFSISAFLFGQQNTVVPLLNGEEIVLQGELETGTGPNNIVAFVDEDIVQVYFSRNFGNVTLSIFNENSVQIYGGVVNTANQHLAIIPISGYSGGTYSLVLSNDNGIAEGLFER